MAAANAVQQCKIRRFRNLDAYQDIVARQIGSEIALCGRKCAASFPNVPVLAHFTMLDTLSKEEKAVTAITLSDSDHGEHDIYIDAALKKRVLRKTGVAAIHAACVDCILGPQQYWRVSRH